MAVTISPLQHRLARAQEEASQGLLAEAIHAVHVQHAAQRQAGADRIAGRGGVADIADDRGARAQLVDATERQASASSG